MSKVWRTIEMVGIGLVITTLVGVGMILERLNDVETVANSVRARDTIQGGLVTRDALEVEITELEKRIAKLRDIHVADGDIPVQ